jgi:7,8-dihydropterin-6-yl-methyl-4-(beta-D-ribofuranosyl)aminobenzene 5'-phosphate synthase
MHRKTFLQATLAGIGTYLFPWKVFAGLKNSDMFKISMIYNNTGECKNLESGWGLSIWIEQNNNATLFDTGGDADMLLHNIKILQLDLNKLNNIVISHNHWDHTNGLEQILEKTNFQPKVFIVENDFEIFENKFPQVKIIPVSNPAKIDDGIWTTGQLVDEYKPEIISEQSVVIAKDDSVFLLTGCSHTGIVEMVKQVKHSFPSKEVKLVAGGFHLLREPISQVKIISDELKKLGVTKLASSHCTGKEAIELFETEWGKQFLQFNLGDQLSI